MSFPRNYKNHRKELNRRSIEFHFVRAVGFDRADANVNIAMQIDEHVWLRLRLRLRITFRIRIRLNRRHMLSFPLRNQKPSCTFFCFVIDNSHRLGVDKCDSFIGRRDVLRIKYEPIHR